VLIAKADGVELQSLYELLIQSVPVFLRNKFCLGK